MENSRKITYIVVLVFIIAAFSLYIRRHLYEFEKILLVNFIDFAVLSCLVILTIFLNGWMFRVIVESFKIKMTVGEWFGLSVVNTLSSYLPLRMGIAARAVYLKKVHNFSYTDFISSLGAANVIMLLCCGIIGLVGMAAMYFSFYTFSPILFILYTVIFLGALFLIFFSLKVCTSEKRFVRSIRDVIEGWDSIKKDKTLLLKLLCINMLLVFTYALRIYYASFALDCNFPFLHALLIVLPGMLAIFITLIPAGLGVREAAIGFSSKLLGGEVPVGIVVSSLDRMVALIWVVLLGSIFSWILFRKVRE